MIKKRYTFWVIILLMLVQKTVLANSYKIYVQEDTISNSQQDTIIKQRYFRIDSAVIIRRQAIRDSLKSMQDSLSFVWIKNPDPNRPNQFLDSLVKLYKIENLDFTTWAKKFAKKTSRYQEGQPLPRGEKWVIVVLLFLIVFLGILKKAFSKELIVIIQSFYSNRILGQINKEDNLFSSWPFIFLYILFGLTIGMFLYLASTYLHWEYSYNGFEWFLILSAAVIGLFTLKVIVLRLLGFFFGIEKLVKVYISILYLSYFNIAIIFLPLVIAFSLTPYRYSDIIGYLAIFMLLFIFIFQSIRAGANILSTYQFPKVYLFLYLCALEICPLLILIKAFGF